MLKHLDRAYLALFREYPLLVRLGIITGAGQIAFALLNISALPIYLLHDLKWSGKMVGAASTTFLLSEMLLKFVMGRGSDRFGRKPFLVLGPLLICLNPIIIVRLPVGLWWPIFPVRTLDGAGAAALWPPLFAMVGDLVPSRSRAAAMSVLNTVYVGAIGAGAALGQVAADLTNSNRFPFYLAAGLLFVSGLTGLFGLPGARTLGQESAPGAASDAADPGAAPAPEHTPYPVPLVLAISLLMTLGVLLLPSFLMPYVRDEIGLSGLQVALLLVGLAVPVLALGLPLGHAADRWGKSQVVRLSLAISALAMWLLPSCRSIWALAAVGVVLALSQVAAMPAWLALISELAPANRRGGIIGLVATAEGLGAALGALFSGWLWDLTRHWGHAGMFYASAALLTAAAIVAGFTLRAKNH